MSQCNNGRYFSKDELIEYIMIVLNRARTNWYLISSVTVQGYHSGKLIWKLDCFVLALQQEKGFYLTRIAFDKGVLFSPAVLGNQTIHSPNGLIGFYVSALQPLLFHHPNIRKLLVKKHFCEQATKTPCTT